MKGVALAICKSYLVKNVQKVNGTVGPCDGRLNVSLQEGFG